MRIAPNEIHIADPECYDTIFNFSSEIEKPSLNGRGDRNNGMVGTDANALNTILLMIKVVCLDKCRLKIRSSTVVRTIRPSRDQL